jgi:hypothetical protein
MESVSIKKNAEKNAFHQQKVGAGFMHVIFAEKFAHYII